MYPQSNEKKKKNTLTRLSQVTEVLCLLCVCVCRVDWIEGKERNQTHTKRELERQCNSGQRIASHCTWADEEEEG
jgi:hypothetical protein